MDLQLFFSTLIKQRRLVAVGVFFGLIVLALSSYSIAFKFDSIYSSPFVISARNAGTYETSVNIAVDSPNFGMGRAGLSPGSWQAFGRSRELAPTYSYIVSSDF
ncbi:MAG: hypothetical protein ACYC56_02400, partial [Candidatus Aquicultor sp.]